MEKCVKLKDDHFKKAAYNSLIKFKIKFMTLVLELLRHRPTLHIIIFKIEKGKYSPTLFCLEQCFSTFCRVVRTNLLQRILTALS